MSAAVVLPGSMRPDRCWAPQCLIQRADQLRYSCVIACAFAAYAGINSRGEMWHSDWAAVADQQQVQVASSTLSCGRSEGRFGARRQCHVPSGEPVACCQCSCPASTGCALMRNIISVRDSPIQTPASISQLLEAVDARSTISLSQQFVQAPLLAPSAG